MYFLLLANPGTTDSGKPLQHLLPTTQAHMNNVRSSLAKKFFDTHRMDHVDLHGHELAILASIPDAQHVKENELCQSFLSNRYLIQMSRMSYNLFLQFLMEHQHFQLTRLTNQHLGIRVTSDAEGKAGAIPSGIGSIGEDTSQYGAVNQRRVLLGQLPMQKAMHEEIGKRLKVEVRNLF